MDFKPTHRLRNIHTSGIRRIYDSAPPGAINLGLGEPDVPLPEMVRQATADALAAGQLGYTANAGLPELRARIAAYHTGRGTAKYTGEQVCVTTGAQEALFATVMATVGPGDEVLIPDPGFPAYESLVALAGGHLRRYVLPARNQFGFDRARFRQALSCQTKVMIVNSPSNPTGRILAEHDLRYIAAVLAEREIIAVSDEVYGELSWGEKPLSLARFYEPTVVISSLSKMMGMTGWRLGWAVGPQPIINAVTTLHQYTTTCAPTLSQQAGLAAFTPAGSWVTAEVRSRLQARRTLLLAEIERTLRLPYVAGEGGCYVMLDIGRLGTAETVARWLLAYGVITIPGTAFGPQGEGFLRVSYAARESALTEGIARMARGLAELERFQVRERSA